jgi:hypothetical protein
VFHSEYLLYTRNRLPEKTPAIFLFVVIEIDLSGGFFGFNVINPISSFFPRGF